jgi:hypothetical protein
MITRVARPAPNNPRAISLRRIARVSVQNTGTAAAAAVTRNMCNDLFIGAKHSVNPSIMLGRAQPTPDRLKMLRATISASVRGAASSTSDTGEPPDDRDPISQR